MAKHLYQGSETVTRQGFQIGWELIQVGERGRSPCPFRLGPILTLIA